MVQLENFLLICGQDGKSYTIYWASIGTENFTKIPIQISGIPEDVTYDPVDDKIYWIEKQFKHSKFSDDKNNNADGKSCTLTTIICRIDFEGTNREIIVTDVVSSADICHGEKEFI